MWSDIHKSCLEFPKVKEVLELMEDVNHDLNKPKEELDIQNVQQKLLTIEKKFGVCGASQPMVIYLNSKFFYELGRFKKAIDPLNSEKFFNDAIQIAAYIKDTSMVLKIKLELAEIYMLKRLPNFTRFSYELNKELEESKDLFRIAKLLCIFGQHFLRNDKESEEFSSRRAISQFSLAINKLKNATGYDQYFLKLLTSSEKKEVENNTNTNTTEESIEIKKEDPLSVLKTSTKEQKNWISWLINIIIVTSDLKISIKEYKEAIEVLKEGKVIAEIEKRKNKQVQIVGKMADVYFNCSEWETCLGCYLECIKILGEKTEQTDHLSILYANVAVCLKNLKRFDESLQYKKLSMELMEKPEDKFEMLVQMGELFIYNQISQQRAKISMQYFEEAKKMLEKPNVVSDIEKAKLELGMAIATFMMKNYEDSIKLFEICIPKLEAPQRSSSFFYLSMIEQERGKLNEAIQHAKDGLSEIAPNMYSKSVVLERLYEGKRHQLLSQLIHLLHEKKDFAQAFVECEKYRALNLISILKLDGNPITSIGPFPRLVNFLALTGLNCVEYFISIEYTKTKKSNSDSNSNSNNDKEDIDDGKEDVSDSPQSIDVIDTEEFDKKEFLYVFVVSSSGNIHCEKFNLEQVLQDHSFEEKKISDVIYNLRKLLGISDDEKDSHFLESKVSSLANLNIEKENLEKANKYLQFLYQLLIEPTLTHLEGEDLVIAPTKELFLLPFYCLQDNNGVSLLEKNLNLSFVPSLSSLLAIRECNLTPTREPENKAFLVSDPSPMAMLTNTITDSTPNLPPLPSYSENWKQESTQIVEVWNTLKVENILSTSQVDSTSEFFYKNYGRCKYLHLSTHFCAEEISPSVNHFGKFALAVNEEIQNSGWISAHLTNYRLPFCSEVVSLSSVVTLSGKLKGDSLSESLQSFIRSGSQSVLSPIASFPQHSFSRLFQLFYSSLSKFPENKAKALRHSLLQIKSESKDNLNPLLWSSYLLFGSTDPFIENLGMSAGLNSLTI